MATQQSDRKFNLDNEKCVLVQFINESDAIQTGFQCWLDERDESKLDELIENKTTIKILWPDCDVKSAAIMKTPIKSAEFQLHPVLILAKGEFLKMNQKAFEWVKYGILSPVKHKRKDRHINAKYIEETSETQKPKKAKEPKTNDNPYRTVMDKLLNLSSSESEKDDIYANSDDEMLPLSKHVAEPDEISEICNSRDESSCKEHMSEMEKLKKKIQVLEEEKRDLADKLQDSTERCEMLQGNVDNLESEISFLKNDLNVLKSNNYKSLHENSIEALLNIKQVASKTLKEQAETLRNNNEHQKMSVKKQSPHQQLRNETSSSRDKVAVRKRTHSRSSLDADNSHVLKESNVGEKKHSNLTEYKISKKLMSNVNCGSIQEFANDLLSKLFTVEELAASSATGKVCNATPDTIPRPALDPIRYDAAKEAAFQKFGKSKKNDSSFNVVATNKCASARKELKRQKEN